MCAGWQPVAETLVARSPATRTSDFDMECYLSAVKEPDPVHEIEMYRLDIASALGFGSGTRSWTLSQSGVNFGERRQAGVSIFVSPLLAACTLEIFPVDKKAYSLCLQIGKKVLTVVCTYVPNDSSVYPAVLESLDGVLEGALHGESVVLLGDINAVVGNDRELEGS